jgi:hypothetical protein
MWLDSAEDVRPTKSHEWQRYGDADVASFAECDILNVMITVFVDISKSWHFS